MFDLKTTEIIECRLMVDGAEKAAATTRLPESGHLDVRPLLQALGVKPSALLLSARFRGAVRKLAALHSCPAEEIVRCTLVGGALWQPVGRSATLTRTTKMYTHPDMFEATAHCLANESLTAFLTSQRQVAQPETTPPSPGGNARDDVSDDPPAEGSAPESTQEGREIGQILMERLGQMTAALALLSTRLDRLEDLAKQDHAGLTDLVKQSHTSLMDTMRTVQDQAQESRQSLLDESVKQDDFNSAVVAFCQEVQATMQGAAPFQARVLQMLEQQQGRAAPALNVNG